MMEDDHACKSEIFIIGQTNSTVALLSIQDISSGLKQKKDTPSSVCAVL